MNHRLKYGKIAILKIGVSTENSENFMALCWFNALQMSCFWDYKSKLKWLKNLFGMPVKSSLQNRYAKEKCSKDAIFQKNWRRCLRFGLSQSSGRGCAKGKRECWSQITKCHIAYVGNSKQTRKINKYRANNEFEMAKIKSEGVVVVAGVLLLKFPKIKYQNVGEI